MFIHGKERNDRDYADHLLKAGLFLIPFFAFSLSAQNVSVTVRDQTNGAAVPYAYVFSRELNGNIKEQEITGKSGEVSLKDNFPALVEVTCVGYKPVTDTLHSRADSVIFISPDFYQLDQVVVTGQFRPQPIDKSIYRIRVIDSRQFRLMSANNVGDVLRNDLSFHYRSEGVLGDFVRIRGLSGEYVKILIDGMPVTGRIGEQIDLGQLNLNNTDHIEVIEGPLSVIYGSSALAGAINIITGDISGKKMQLETDLYYETIGTYNGNLSFSSRQGSSTFSFHGGRNFFSGWGPVTDDRYKIWKPKLQYLAGFGYQFRHKEFRANLYSDYIHEELRDAGNPYPDSSTITAIDGYHYTARWNNRFNLTRTFNNNLVLNFQAGYSYFQKRKISYINDLVDLKKTLHFNPEMHDTTVFQLLSARGFLSNIPGKKFEYQAGFDMNHESADGKRTSGYQYISEIAGFLNTIYRPLPSLSLQPGLRVMHNSRFHAPLVYAFNVKYNEAGFTARTSYARGFRSPSLKQLYLEFIDNNHHIYGNQDLKAETADNVSFSLQYDRSKAKFSMNFQLDVFYNSIDQAIQLAIDTHRPGYGMYFNVSNGRYKTKGFEIRTGYRLVPSLELNAGVIITGRSLYNENKKFEYSTDWVGSAIYRFEKYKTQLALFYKYTGSYLDFAGNYDASGKLDGISQQFMASYNMLDFTATQNLIKDQLTLSAGIKNIFNVKLVDSFGSIDPHGTSDAGGAAGYGRTFFFSLNYRFTKL